MKVGDRMLCAYIGRDGKEAGASGPVEVREITRNHMTGEPVSVRVKCERDGRPAWLWVQAQYLRPRRAA